MHHRSNPSIISDCVILRAIRDLLAQDLSFELQLDLCDILLNCHWLDLIEIELNCRIEA